MQYTSLKNLFRSVTPISDAEWQDFEQYFSFRRLNKNENLWNEGVYCKHLCFVNNGLVYCFFNKDGKEITTNLYFDNSIFYDDYSFIRQEPCLLNYVALEVTELIIIPRVGLYEMFDRYKSFERLGRMMVERNHTTAISEQLNINGLTSEEKYVRLIQRQPDAIQRIPLKIIASYLNITPEHLSRIRKKISASFS